METAIDKNKSVKQSNNLAISRYTLTTLEQRILYAVCSQMPRNTDDFESVRMSVADLADFCGITSTNKYTSIKQISNKLMRRIVTIPTHDGGEYTSHWLQSRRYYPEDSTIEFKMDSDLKKEFLKLRKAYLDIPAVTLMSFKKVYSSRMYLILKRMIESSGKNTCEFEYKISFFKEKFELGKTYDKISNLKNGVLNPALQEINEKSDIHVKYEYIKSGKICSKIKFTVSMKEEKKQDNQENLTPLESKNEMTEEEQKMYERLINPNKWKIQTDVAKKLIKDYNLTRIDENIKHVDTFRQTLKNPGGFLIDSIKFDRAADKRKAEAEIKAASEQEKENQKEKYLIRQKGQIGWGAENGGTQENKGIEDNSEPEKYEIQNPFLKELDEKHKRRIKMKTEPTPEPPKKKRGRPPKKKPEPDETT